MNLVEKHLTRHENNCNRAIKSILAFFDKSAILNCLLTITIQLTVIVWMQSCPLPNHVTIGIKDGGENTFTLFEMPRPRILLNCLILFFQNMPALFLICVLWIFNRVKSRAYLEKNMLSQWFLCVFIAVKLVDSTFCTGDINGVAMPLILLLINQIGGKIPGANNNIQEILISIFCMLGVVWAGDYISVEKALQSRPQLNIIDFLEREGLVEHKRMIKAFSEENAFPVENIVLSNTETSFLGASMRRILFKSRSYIILDPFLFNVFDPNSVIAILKHEIAHSDHFNYLLSTVLVKIVVPVILFNTIINRELSKAQSCTLTINRALKLFSKIVLVSKVAGIGLCLLSNFMEYRADRNALDTPESAVGLAKAFIRFIQEDIDTSPTIGIFGRDYDILSTHPFTINRLQRVSERYPELVSVTYNLEQRPLKVEN